MTLPLMGVATAPLPLAADPDSDVDPATEAFAAAWDARESDVSLIGRFGPVTPAEQVHLHAEARLVRALRRRLTTTVRRSYPTADRVAISPIGSAVHPVAILDRTTPLATTTREAGTTTLFYAITPDVASLVRDFDQAVGATATTVLLAAEPTPRRSIGRPELVRDDYAPAGRLARRSEASDTTVADLENLPEGLRVGISVRWVPLHGPAARAAIAADMATGHAAGRRPEPTAHDIEAERRIRARHLNIPYAGQLPAL